MKRLTVIVGHFGSGKTEIAVNIAVKLGQEGTKFSLVDLDIVDPYFRSRERRDILEAVGGTVIASSPTCIDADMPSMPPAVAALWNSEQYGIFDIGGDPAGARVLARYRYDLVRHDAAVWCVINGNRPLSATAEQATAYVDAIQEAAGLAITGLINNTHCCQLTTVNDVRNGAALTAQVSQKTGIPIVYHAVTERLVTEAAAYVQPILPLTLYMKKPWE